MKCDQIVLSFFVVIYCLFLKIYCYPVSSVLNCEPTFLFSILFRSWETCGHFFVSSSYILLMFVISNYWFIPTMSQCAISIYFWSSPVSLSRWIYFWSSGHQITVIYLIWLTFFSQGKVTQQHQIMIITFKRGLKDDLTF